MPVILPSSKVICSALAALVMVELASADVAAQTTPPRPNVTAIQTGAPFFYGTWPGDFDGDGKTDLIGAEWTGAALDLRIANSQGPSGSLGVPALPVGVG